MNATPQEESEILEIFINSLELPNKKLNKQVVVAPVGVIGAGKTTILNLLSKKIPLVVVSGDVIRKELGKRGLDFRGVYSIGRLASDKLLTEGYSIAIDSDCVRDDVIAMLKKHSENYDAELLWIHINTPEEQCVKNIRERGTTIFGVEPEAMIESYKDRKTKFHDKEFKRHLTCVFSGNHSQTDKEVSDCVKNIKSALDSSS